MVVALLLAGCAGAEGPPQPRVMVIYLPSPAAIEVSVLGPALASALLVDAEGRATAAETIMVERDPIAASPSPDIGVGVFGGSRGGVGTGVFVGVPILGPARTERSSSRARVPLPDLEAYRAQWRTSVLRLTFAGARGVGPIDVPAPEPR
jgi:hypothetical protein